MRRRGLLPPAPAGPAPGLPNGPCQMGWIAIRGGVVQQLDWGAAKAGFQIPIEEAEKLRDGLDAAIQRAKEMSDDQPPLSDGAAELLAEAMAATKHWSDIDV